MYEYFHPALPVSFGGDNKSRRSLLSDLYARGSKISHTGGGGGKRSLYLSWTPPLSEKDNYIKITMCLILRFECSQYRRKTKKPIL